MDACILSLQGTRSIRSLDAWIAIMCQGFSKLADSWKELHSWQSMLECNCWWPSHLKSTSTQANGLTNEMSWHRALEVQTSLQVCQVSTFASQQESTHRSVPAQGDI
jgi:hypothetical protein